MAEEKTRVEDVKLFVEIGIVLASALAGFIWAPIINTSSSSANSGFVGGLLAGFVLVLTARLARMR